MNTMHRQYDHAAYLDALQSDSCQPCSVAVETTYAGLRIFKYDGSPATDLTARLGIQPTKSHDAGDLISPGSPNRRPHSLWSLSTKDAVSGSLQEHLTWLLDRVEPIEHVLHALSEEGCELDWFCFVSLDESGQGGVSFDLELLRRLAALPIHLELDLYGS
ncbi:DUF4279 domain-containing protein [Kribbella sp.]|uniref:DUF4279 domain-containing protein n=1 Tax=Kribbella sp. TaxID=1871183 RepID=UPI002D53E626|nr:DUF4279 domain-containing protein [Kribbella sp.]HZX03117.1 DUF4279 domain-containing protein [Kribbella sp.]